MTSRALAASALLALAATAAAAHEEDAVTPATLKAYAAMAKLEANKAEAAGAVLLGVATGGSGEAAEDFRSDADQIAGYIAALKAMDLTEAQADAIAAFDAQWTEAAARGRDLMDSDDATLADAVAWWESLDGLDDLVDDQMEDILAAHGAGFD